MLRGRHLPGGVCLRGRVVPGLRRRQPTLLPRGGLLRDPGLRVGGLYDAGPVRRPAPGLLRGELVQPRPDLRHGQLRGGPCCLRGRRADVLRDGLQSRPRVRVGLVPDSPRRRHPGRTGDALRQLGRDLLRRDGLQRGARVPERALRHQPGRGHARRSGDALRWRRRDLLRRDGLQPGPVVHGGPVRHASRGRRAGHPGRTGQPRRTGRTGHSGSLWGHRRPVLREPRVQPRGGVSERHLPGRLGRRRGRRGHRAGSGV